MPSGLLWAKQNIGASGETDYGLYFSWGETKGYVDAKSKTNRGATGFTWGSYEYITGTSGSAAALTKYNSSDGKTVLELEDDAAHVNMGGNWRTPTNEEYQELIENTTISVNTINGVNGYKLTSKTDNSKYVFFPAGGMLANNSHDDGFALYWTSDVYTQPKIDARSVRGAHGDFKSSHNNRCHGLNIRGIMNFN